MLTTLELHDACFLSGCKVNIHITLNHSWPQCHINGCLQGTVLTLKTSVGHVVVDATEQPLQKPTSTNVDVSMPGPISDTPKLQTIASGTVPAAAPVPAHRHTSVISHPKQHAHRTKKRAKNGLPSRGSLSDSLHNKFSFIYPGQVDGSESASADSYHHEDDDVHESLHQQHGHDQFVQRQQRQEGFREERGHDFFNQDDRVTEPILAIFMHSTRTARKLSCEPGNNGASSGEVCCKRHLACRFTPAYAYTMYIFPVSSLIPIST